MFGRLSNLSSMKVPELQTELKSRGLDHQGLKAVFIERLEEALQVDSGATSSQSNMEIDPLATSTQVDNAEATCSTAAQDVNANHFGATTCSCNQEIRDLKAEIENLKKIVQTFRANSSHHSADMQIEIERLKRENEALIITTTVLSSTINNCRSTTTETTTRSTPIIVSDNDTISSTEISQPKKSGQKKPKQNVDENPKQTKQKKPNLNEGARISDERQDTSRSKQRGEVLIVGDSLLKDLQGHRMSKNGNVKVYSFSGSKTEDLHDHLKPLFRRHPIAEKLILHVGTNSLKDNRRNPRAVAEEIVDLAREVSFQQPDIEMCAISSVVSRTDDGELDQMIPDVNKILQKFCRQNDWNFIDNSGINSDHLNRSKLHLNKSGSALLARHFISFVRGEGN